VEAIFLQSVFDDALQHPNFFNGRILTATDLSDEQAAAQKRSRWLGMAIGEGVAYGLAVRQASGASLSISSGLAVNRRGEALWLPGDVTLNLVDVRTQASAGGDSPFQPCDIPAAVTTTGVVSAEYSLLTITRASRDSSEIALTSSLNGSGGLCSQSRYADEGVQFKLIPLRAVDFGFTLPAAAALRQSAWAHQFFATAGWLANAARPLTQGMSYGLIDTLRAMTNSPLTDCDVPLAFVRFADGAVQFVDMWAVRRGCTTVGHADAFPFQTGGARFTQYAASPRREREAAAMLLQFQGQLERLRQTDSNPLTLKAVEHFVYLPSAGYLDSTSTAVTTGRRFNPTVFFGTTIPRKTLDLAYVRAVFQSSLFIEPIPVGTSMPIDLYEVPGSDPNDPYVIFVRREPVVAVTPPKPPEVEVETPESRTGDLIIAVMDEKGKPVSKDSIERVGVTNVRTGQNFSAGELAGGDKKKAYGTFSSQFREKSYQIASKYGKEAAFDDSAWDVLQEQYAIYALNNLPVGIYTIGVSPANSRYSTSSASVNVAPNTDNTATVTLKARGRTKPDEGVVTFRPPLVVENGHIYDKAYARPKWKEYVELDEDRLHDWLRFEGTVATNALEDLLPPFVEEDPRVSTNSPMLYIDPDYDPNNPAAAVYAVMQTEDGSLHPVVLVASEYALDQRLSATQANIADVDAATYASVLQPNGLGDLEVLAAAPAVLVGAVMGIETESARSLVSEAQVAVEESFKGRFIQYAGIDTAANAVLMETFGDTVGVANATPEQVLTVLNSIPGKNYSAGFAERFVDKVRGTLPTESWSLAGLNLSANEMGALGAAGVLTRGGLVDAAKDDAARAGVLAALGTNEAGLTRITGKAVAGIAGGQFVSATNVSVANVAGVTGEIASGLVGLGITSAAELANADRTALATELNLSAVEINAIVTNATENSYGFSTILTNLGVSEEKIGELSEAGILSMGDLARTDETALAGILNVDAGAAGSISTAAGLVMTGNFASGGFMRGGRVR
jgi:hypothetical protein